MPLAAPLPFDVMLRNSNLFAPIVVLTTFNADPVVAVNVLTNAPVDPGTHGVSSQTLTVPPPVALKAVLAPLLMHHATSEGNNGGAVSREVDARARAAHRAVERH